MSRHTYQSDQYTITVGVDRPLQYVFGSVMEAGSKHPIILGDPIENYPPSEEGVSLVLSDAARYLKAPESVRAALLEDLDKLFAGGDLNYVKKHELDP